MSFNYIASAKQTIASEVNAIQELATNIDDTFTQACELILACQGKVILTGMGKSGHVANKIAATLASTGTPAFFVHPAEANHGDMGMIDSKDLVIAISNSGNTAELSSLISLAARGEISLISMTGNQNSALARAAKINLDISVSKEACPLDLAPTSSTTVTMVMGDALAVALLQARGFNARDFARSHPGGGLGRRLLVTVADIMHGGKKLPSVLPSATIDAAILEMTAKGLGMTCVIDEDGQLHGIFTDGDLRRVFTQQDSDIHHTPVSEVMTSSSKTIEQSQLAVSALEIMNKFSINAIIATRDGKPVGALNMHDLLKAQII